MRSFSGKMDRDGFYKWLNPALPIDQAYDRARLGRVAKSLNALLRWLRWSPATIQPGTFSSGACCANTLSSNTNNAAMPKNGKLRSLNRHDY